MLTNKIGPFSGDHRTSLWVIFILKYNQLLFPLRSIHFGITVLLRYIKIIINGSPTRRKMLFWMQGFLDLLYGVDSDELTADVSPKLI